MMKLRKSRVALAVGAALGAAALMPATSFGWSVDTYEGTLVTASGGDTLLFPVYSTVNTTATSFSVTNTSDQTIAAKIRFREQSRSMDVLDFYVILSAYDKFDFTVQKPAGSERPVMTWKDNSCVVGPGDTGSVQFPPPSPFVDDDEVMSVGHLEVLGVANFTNVCVLGTEAGSCEDAPTNAISLAEAADHGSDGEPDNCGVFSSWLGSTSNVETLNDALYALGPASDVPNVLVGRYVITGQGLGIEAGSDAVGIRDSDLGPYYGPPMTAQSGADCVNCESVYAWDGSEWDHPHLGEMYSLVGFQYALRSANISGDWSNNPANMVGVDWMLSFPNKYAYLDYVPASDCPGGASTGEEWCLLRDPRTGYGVSGAWTGTDASGNADLCLGDNQLAVWDTEEQEAAGNVTVSPGTRTTLDVCNEMQVFTLAAPGQDVRDSIIQTADRRSVITFENLDAVRGWARMDLNWPTSATPFPGDSITGVLFTTRNTDDPTINNGSITDLQKCVGCDID